MRVLLLILSLVLLPLTGCSAGTSDTVNLTHHTCAGSRYNSYEQECVIYEMTVRCSDDPDWCEQVKILQDKTNLAELKARSSFQKGYTPTSTKLEGEIDGTAINTAGNAGVLMGKDKELFATTPRQDPNFVYEEPESLIDCERLSRERQEQLRCP